MKYQGENTREICFPVGGIGTGSVGIAGNGRFLDWEIYNRPAKITHHYYSHFSVKAECDGRIVDARILQGDLIGSFMGDPVRGSYCGYGHGPDTFTMAGMPHFRNCLFDGEFPFANLTFTDENFPASVKLCAFNPFIPRNEDDSSIPAGFYEIEFTNTTDKEICYTACLSVKNPNLEKAVNRFESDGRIAKIFMTTDAKTPDEIGYYDMCIATDAEKYSYQECWYRAGWKDDFITYWHNFNDDLDFKNRSYEGYSERGGDHASIAPKLKLMPGESGRVRFILAWNVPVNYNYWDPCKKKVGDKEVDVTWKNYYSILFKNSSESAQYALENWDRLYAETKRFKDELFSQTLPARIIEAISCTISVLKSPTVFRLEDGSLYGFEGCLENEGACEGTCTHVWNYAYAVPFLFPRLERSIRDLDYKYNYKDHGKLEFRMALPLGREDYKPFHACVDGQMGGVFKVYREWKICGDDEWLKKNWEHIKGAIAYAWDPENEDHWDSDHDGILDGRQHNTLDTELFTASSWLEGYYLAALKAASIMARHLGDIKEAEDYERMYANGKKYLEDNLFNGEYYYQKIDLNDYDLVKDYDDADGVWNEEVSEVKYQVGEGCVLLALDAQWHSYIIGLGDIFDPERVKIAALNMYKNNFKKSMRNHANPWRLYCIDDEAGAVICEYPKGKRKPAIPLAYAEETMHGFEYVLAALLIKNGEFEKGLEVINGVRDRYDGIKRNPFNEMECGSNYVRNMCTFSYIPIYSGFEFDMTKGLIGFKPIVDGYFKAIWSLDMAWGNFEVDGDDFALNIISGELALNEIRVPFEGASAVSVDGENVEFTAEGRNIRFKNTVSVNKNVKVVK